MYVVRRGVVVESSCISYANVLWYNALVFGAPRCGGRELTYFVCLSVAVDRSCFSRA